MASLGQSQANLASLQVQLEAIRSAINQATNPAQISLFTDQALLLNEAIKKVTKEIVEMQQALGVLPSRMSAFNTGFAAMGNQIASITGLGQKLGSMFGMLGAKIGGAVGQGISGAVGAGQAAASMASGGVDMAALGALAGGVGAAVGAITQLTEAIKPLVAAFNPAIVMQFNMAIENVMAALGASLLPIIQQMIPVFNSVNVIFTALYSTLQPTISMIANLLAGTFQRALVGIQPVISIVASLFGLIIQNINPLLQIFPTIMSLLAAPLTVLAELLKVANEVMEPFTDIFTLFLDAVTNLSQLLVRLIVPPLQLFSNIVKSVMDTIKGFINAFVDWYNRQDWLPGRLAHAGQARGGLEGPQTVAARQASTIGIEEIGVQLRSAAMGLSIGERQLAEAQRQNDLLRDILNAVQVRNEPVAGPANPRPFGA